MRNARGALVHVDFILYGAEFDAQRVIFFLLAELLFLGERRVFSYCRILKFMLSFLYVRLLGESICLWILKILEAH